MQTVMSKTIPKVQSVMTRGPLSANVAAGWLNFLGSFQLEDDDHLKVCVCACVCAYAAPCEILWGLEWGLEGGGGGGWGRSHLCGGTE